VDLELSGEQRQLQQLIRQYWTDRPARGDSSFGMPLTAETWQQLGALGILDLAAAGDVSDGIVEQVIVAEELGRALLGSPYAWTAAYVVPILNAAGGQLLASVVAGRQLVSFGPGGTHVGWDGESLSGDWDLVSSFGSTDHYLLAEDAGSCVRLWLADAAQPGVDVDELASLDLAGTMQSLRLTRASARLIATIAASRLREFEMRARVLLAAELTGVANAAIDAASAYANVRTTFGRPIGSYQAISHPLADSLAQLEGLRSLVFWAACHVETGAADAMRLSLAAKALAGEVAVEATARALHTFGGIGFTWEHPIHRFYRRAIAANATSGPSFDLSRELGLDLLAGPESGWTRPRSSA
jgi:alkylation response protein AidB-like acyl-CoA dehydrogenase